MPARSRCAGLSIAEAARFPEGSARYFDVVLALPHERLAAYLTETFGLSPQASAREAQLLVGRIVHPRFPRALFGLDTLSDRLDDEAIRPDFDLEPVRTAVAELVASLKGRRKPARLKNTTNQTAATPPPAADRLEASGHGRSRPDRLS